MRRRRAVASFSGFALIAGLTGCAAAAEPALPSVTSPAPSVSQSMESGEDVPADPSGPVPIAPRDMPPADEAAEARAATWLAAIDLPPGAIEMESAPPGSTAIANSYSAWVCEPMAMARGYWLVPDLSLAETANWLVDHPTADLQVNAAERYAEDPRVDGISFGHAPTATALEGVAFTVARADDGIAVRAEIGAFGDTTECPESDVGLGGPGQG